MQVKLGRYCAAFWARLEQQDVVLLAAREPNVAPRFVGMIAHNSAVLSASQAAPVPSEALWGQVRLGAGAANHCLKLLCGAVYSYLSGRSGAQQSSLGAGACSPSCGCALRTTCQHYRSTAQVWQTLNIGKSPRAPNNLIISGAVHGQIGEHCLGVVCQTLAVLG